MELTPKYLDYCAITFKITPKSVSRDLANNILRVFYEAPKIMMKDSIFNNPEILLEYDKYHIAIYEADENAFREKPNWLSNPYVK